MEGEVYKGKHAAASKLGGYKGWKERFIRGGGVAVSKLGGGKRLRRDRKVEHVELSRKG